MSLEMQVSPQALPAVQILQQMRAGGGEVGAAMRMGVQVGDGRMMGTGVQVDGGRVELGSGVREDDSVGALVLMGVQVDDGRAVGSALVEMGDGVCVAVMADASVAVGVRVRVAVRVGADV